MLTDSELLELAAKAVGIKLRYNMYGHQWAGEEWEPLTDDGAAFRLAVSMCLPLDIEDEATHVRPLGVSEPHNGNPLAATRRAIVRAAAAMVSVSKGSKK